MRPTNISYDEGILREGKRYTVGTDGKEFRKVLYEGTRLLNGKPMMIFRTADETQLEINPSFHTFTLEELEQSEEATS